MRQFYLIIRLFILLLSIPHMMYAQYKSFFGTEEIWAIREYVSLAGYPPDVDYTYSFIRDTVIKNGNAYNKIVHTFKKTGDTMYVLYAREELNTGKMYLYDSVAGIEFLFIDMSLKLGDTFRTNIHHNEPIYVDSVYLEQGLKHLRLRSRNWENYMEWVEGVGANYSVYTDPKNTISIQLAMYEYHLYCFFKDSRNYYTNNGWKGATYDCNIWLSINDREKISRNIKIYPNPVSDRLNIEGINTGEKTTVKIYDLMGRLQVEKDLTSDLLSIAHLPTGLYILVLQNAQGDTLHRTQLRVEK